LLEADVALQVARDFVEQVTEKAVGREVLRSVTPGQMVVKIVNDALVETLGAETAELNLAVNPPVVIMMVGLQGSGKTTTTAKLAKRLTERERKKVLMASLDVARPAAQEQLAVLGRQSNIETLPIVTGQQPVDIARRAIQSAKLQGYDVVLLDTAGRLHVDDQLMDELSKIRRVLGRLNPEAPHDVLLVLDATTGQNALAQVDVFRETAGVTGLIMTKLDGSARGGILVAAAEKFGLPIHAIGVGETADDLRPFDPRAVARAIAGLPPE
jgi:signal recognition particle subunit SRP54